MGARVTIKQGTTIPQLDMLFRVISLHRSRTYAAHGFSTHQERGDLPHQSIRRGGLVLEFRLFCYQQGDLQARIGNTDYFTRTTVIHCDLGMFRLEGLRELLRERPDQQPAHPRVEFSPEFLPPEAYV